MDRSNVGILSDYCNQKGAKLEGKVLNVPVDLCSNSHLCSCTLSRKWKNKFAETTNQTEFPLWGSTLDIGWGARTPRGSLEGSHCMFKFWWGASPIRLEGGLPHSISKGMGPWFLYCCLSHTRQLKEWWKMPLTDKMASANPVLTGS